MADNVTTIDSRLRVPGVPRGARPRALTGAAQGLREASRAVAFAGAARAELGRAAQGAGGAGFDAALVAEGARQEQEIGKATNAGLERLNELEIEVGEGADDVKTASESFDKGAERIREEIGRDFATDSERRAFGDSFTQLATVRKGRVQKTALGRQRDANRAILTANLEAFSREAAAADTQEERDAVAVIAAGRIAAVRDAGFISPQEAQRLENGFVEATAEVAARNLINRDPRAAVAVLEDDQQLAGLDPLTRTTLTSQAQARVRQAENRANAGMASLRSALKADVKEIVSVSEQGLPVDPELIERARATAQALGDTQSDRRLQEAAAILDFTRDLAQQTPADAQREVSKLEAKLQRTGATGFTAAAVKAGRQVLTRMNRELARDPLSYAVTAGVLPVAPLDLSDKAPEMLPQFAQRRQQALAVADWYAVEPRFFTDEERTLLASRFKGGTADSRRQMVTAMVAGFGDNAPQALAEISVASPVPAHLGGLRVLGPQHETTVREGFRGLSAIEDKTVELPPAAQLRDLTEAELGGALDSRLTAVQRNIRETAKAVYAARALDRGLVEFDENVYRESVRAASGEWRLGDAVRGGLASYNGHRLLLPQHLSEDGFADAIEGLTEADLVVLSAGGGRPVHRRASGRTRRAMPAEFEDAYFVSVGVGKYQVSMTDPASGAPQYLLDEDTGRFYLLDLTDPGETPRTGSEPSVTLGAVGAP